MPCCEPLYPRLDGLYHLQILRLFQIFDGLVRSDDNGEAVCTIAERVQDNCDSAREAGAPEYSEDGAT
jgi:hypothetical protein